jgi:hypothetical protein
MRKLPWYLCFLASILVDPCVSFLVLSPHAWQVATTRDQHPFRCHLRSDRGGAGLGRFVTQSKLPSSPTGIAMSGSGRGGQSVLCMQMSSNDGKEFTSVHMKLGEIFNHERTWLFNTLCNLREYEWTDIEVQLFDIALSLSLYLTHTHSLSPSYTHAHTFAFSLTLSISL